MDKYKKYEELIQKSAYNPLDIEQAVCIALEVGQNIISDMSLPRFKDDGNYQTGMYCLLSHEGVVEQWILLEDEIHEELLPDEELNVYIRAINKETGKIKNISVFDMLPGRLSIHNIDMEKLEAEMNKEFSEYLNSEKKKKEEPEFMVNRNKRKKIK